MDGLYSLLPSITTRSVIHMGWRDSEKEVFLLPAHELQIGPHKGWSIAVLVSGFGFVFAASDLLLRPPL